MIPQLQKVYGGDPMSWYQDVPLYLLRCFTEMLPVVQATESLSRFGEIRVAGADLTKDHTARGIVEKWERAASKFVPTHKPTPEERDAMAVMSGIKVVKE